MKQRLAVLFSFFLAGGVFFGSFVHAVTSPSDICGEWYTKGKEAVVRIFQEGETFSGQIVWLCEASATDENGEPARDTHNPNPELAQKPIVGLRLAHSFSHAGGDDWEGGFIYDPESGKTYKCLMELQDGGNTLKVKGFVGVSLFGRSEYWRRKL